MNLIVEENIQAWVSRINEILKESVQDNDVIFLPAGSTPIPLYQDWTDHNYDFLDNIQFQQIDEVIGTKKFEDFFKENLPNHLVMPIHDQPVKGDIAILGVGLNGHVGFHEPHIPFDFSHGEVELTEKSCETLQLNYPQRGLTYGLASFIKCRKIIIIARGESKKDILKECLKPESNLPCAHILRHHSCELVINFPI